MRSWIRRKTYLPLFAVLGLVLLAGSWTPASAGTLTSNLTASVTVIEGCTALTANNINFGTWISGSTSVLTAQTTVSVTCANAVSYTLSADGGANKDFGPSFSRKMMPLGGVYYVLYELYKDSAMTDIWGPYPSGTAISGAGNGTGQSISIYGKATGGAATFPGNYTDYVLVTLSF